MRGIEGPPLYPMGGRGVGQLDVVGDVGGRDYHFTAATGSLHGHAAVVIGRGHDPTITVLYPALAGSERAVVLAVDDFIPPSGRLASGYSQSKTGDGPRCHPIGPGSP